MKEKYCSEFSPIALNQDYNESLVHYVLDTNQTHTLVGNTKATTDITTA